MSEAIHNKTLKSQFPQRNFCFLADNLFAVESFVKLVLSKGWHVIITAKPERNKELFFMFEYLKEQQKHMTYTDINGYSHHYRYSNNLPIKQDTSKEEALRVNLVEYSEFSPTGELVYCSSWLTDFEITNDNVKIISQSGRARFAIENRNFNEQKNLGFQTEHNFGHFGNLPNVFFGLAQIAQLLTELFRFWRPAKALIDSVGSKRRYFERLAVQIGSTILEDDSAPILNLKFIFSSS